MKGRFSGLPLAEAGKRGWKNRKNMEQMFAFKKSLWYNIVVKETAGDKEVHHGGTDQYAK
jgi:hypothetical protein